MGLVLVAAAANAASVFPGATWATAAPESVGMNRASLDKMSAYVGGRGCVVRHGRMVYTWGGDQSRRQDVASACKPVYAHFLFHAYAEGKIPSFNEKVVKWEPRLNDINAALGHKDSNITWRELANQTSCYGVTEPPGTAFDYNDYNMALFWDTLFLKVYGVTYENVDETLLHPTLTDLIGCQDSPSFEANKRQGRFAVSTRDFARFGLLYLHQGNWNGKQIMSRKLAMMAVASPLSNSIPRTKAIAAEMIPGQRSIGSDSIPDDQADHSGSYSWAWWLNGVDRTGARHWPDAPADTYGAWGNNNGKRAVIVIPSLDIVISWNDTVLDKREGNPWNEALKMVVDSIKPVRWTVPGQIIPDKSHPQWLARAGGKRFFMCGPGDPEGFLYLGNRRPDGTRDGDQMARIQKLAKTGANCIYMIAVRSHGGDGDATQNPFIDSDPTKQLDERILSQWETWFAEMDKRGIVTYLFIYDDSARIWNTGDLVGTEERSLIRGIVNRFKHHKNLIWCVAEEYKERYTPARVKAIAAEIRRADEFSHPIAVHKLQGLDFSEFAEDPNIDQFAVQYNVATAAELHKGIVSAWKAAKGRYNLNMSEAKNMGTGPELRKKLWACAMGGAYAMVLDTDIANTPESDLRDCGRLVKFFESTNLSGTAPHDEMAYGATEYVLAKPGQSYLIYISKPGKMGVKNLPAGNYQLRWYNPATGVWTKTTLSARAGSLLLARPRGMGGEAVLVLERRARGKSVK